MENTSSPAGQGPVNWDEGLKRVAGNRALFEKLLHRIAGDLPNDLASIEQALAGGNMESVSEIAHSLKGSAGNLSITTIYQQTIELEAAAKNGNTAKAAEILGQLKESAAQFVDYLNTL